MKKKKKIFSKNVQIKFRTMMGNTIFKGKKKKKSTPNKETNKMQNAYSPQATLTTAATNSAPH